MLKVTQKIQGVEVLVAKKIKRQIRQKAKLQTEKGLADKNVHEDSPIAADCPSSSNLDALPGPSSNQNGSHAPFSSHKTDEEESDTSEDEIIPVVVRPGHIRFEPAGMVLHSPFYVNPSLCITGQAVSREHDYVSICATLTCIFVSSLKHKCC